jgi:hypothetical protein
MDNFFTYKENVFHYLSVTVGLILIFLVCFIYAFLDFHNFYRDEECYDWGSIVELNYYEYPEKYEIIVKCVGVKPVKMVGNSEYIKNIYNKAGRYIHTDKTVLVSYKYHLFYIELTSIKL